MPNRPASQPVNGVMIAAATMYDVTTQAIWSCEHEKLPCICGSATLAIVVSTPCINVASMIDAVMAPRLIRGPSAASARVAALDDAELRIYADVLQEARRGQMLSGHHACRVSLRLRSRRFGTRASR